MLEKLRKQQTQITKPNRYQVLPSLKKNRQNGSLPTRQLLSNQQLMSNSIYVFLVAKIQQYNKNLQILGQQTIIKYKLYQFLYDCLLHCKTKVNSQLDQYLQMIKKQFQRFQSKRRIKIKKKNNIFDAFQQQNVRSTFKSNLPLQIDEFKRKKLIKKQIQLIRQQDQMFNNVQHIKKYKIYHLQLKQIRRKIQQKQQLQFYKNSKKNQSRIQSQTCKNFYKPMWNKNTSNHNYTNGSNIYSKPAFFKTGINFKKTSTTSNHFSQSQIKNDSLTQYVQNVDGLGLIKNHIDLNRKTKKDKS